jgi:hypothetical protein
MLFLLPLLLLFVTVSAVDYEYAFLRYVEQYGKTYSSVAEVLERYAIFQDNLDIITEHNSQPEITSTMGIHKYSDLASDEMAMMLNGFQLPWPRGYPGRSRTWTLWSDQHRHPREQAPPHPAFLNWTALGAVTPVKDQVNTIHTHTHT